MSNSLSLKEMHKKVLEIVEDCETIESELFQRKLDTRIAMDVIDSGIELATILDDPDDITPLMTASYFWYLKQYELLMRITVGVTSLPLALEHTQTLN